MSAKVNPKDFSVKTKWEEQAAEADAKQAKVDSVQRRLFNPAKLTEQVNAIHEEEDPNLGVIRYGELSLHDAFTIEKCKNDADKSSMAAYLMLKKGNPDMPTYTPENISEWQKSMPMAEGAMLLLFIRKSPVFLRTQSLPGLAKTETPKTSQ
jgi:hypothetical protein